MNVDLFLDRVVFMARNFGDCDPRCMVRICLMDIGVPCHFDGYKFIARGATVKHENPDAMITKHIYPAIAKEYRCSTMQVEASFRRAVEAAHKNRNDRWICYFPDGKRPSNDEFLGVICELLDFWEVCRRNISEE